MRKKNDQSLRCELAETKLASSLLYLSVVPKYIYIYRRKKMDITLHSLSLGHEYRSSITVVQQKIRDGNSHKSSVRVRFQRKRLGKCY